MEDRRTSWKIINSQIYPDISEDRCTLTGLARTEYVQFKFLKKCGVDSEHKVTDRRKTKGCLSVQLLYCAHCLCVCVFALRPRVDLKASHLLPMYSFISELHPQFSSVIMPAGTHILCKVFLAGLQMPCA